MDTNLFSFIVPDTSGSGNNEYRLVHYGNVTNQAPASTPDFNVLGFQQFSPVEQYATRAQPSTRALKFGTSHVQEFRSDDVNNDGAVDLESVSHTRFEDDGWLMFTAPIYYDANTAVIFSFEGVDYARAPGVPLDLTRVKYEGNDPVVTNNVTGQVGYLITVNGGDFYTIDASSFDWPPGYSVTSATNNCNNCPPYQGTASIYTITDADWLSFGGFHNSEIEVRIVGPKELWWFHTVVLPDFDKQGNYRAIVISKQTGQELPAQGTYEWHISGPRGPDALAILDNGLHQDFTYTDDNNVSVVTTDYSLDFDDVVLRLRYITPNDDLLVAAKTLTVRTFKLLLPFGPEIVCTPGVKWDAYQTQWITDQFGTANNNPTNYCSPDLLINEQFSDHVRAQCATCAGGITHWNLNPNPFGGQSCIPHDPPLTEFQDHVNSEVINNPADPMVNCNSTDLVDSYNNTWRFGSATIGGGDAFLRGGVHIRRRLNSATFQN